MNIKEYERLQKQNKTSFENKSDDEVYKVADREIYIPSLPTGIDYEVAMAREELRKRNIKLSIFK